MDADFRSEVVEETLVRHDKPAFFNTDQGSQLTNETFTGLLARNGIAIGKDGKGVWRDDILTARPWRTVKYEEVRVKAHQGLPKAGRRSADAWISTTAGGFMRTMVAGRRTRPGSRAFASRDPGHPGVGHLPPTPSGARARGGKDWPPRRL